MGPVRWLVMVGWQACLGPLLCAQEPGLPACAGWVELTRACPDPASHWLPADHGEPLPEERHEPGLWHPWALALGGARCPCLAAPPGSAPAAPHWHGARAAAGRMPAVAIRNLVEEVRPISLDDPNGGPWGTFR
jgi:hypothetical protein